MKASSAPSARAPFTSFALAARRVFSRSTRASAATSRARFLAAVPARASTRLASRAARPSAATRAGTSLVVVRSFMGSFVAGHLPGRLVPRPCSGRGRSAGLPASARREFEDLLPRVARLDAFDHAVYPVRPQELPVEGGGVVLARGALDALHAVRRRGSGAAARLPRSASSGEAPRRGSRAAAAAGSPSASQRIDDARDAARRRRRGSRRRAPSRSKRETSVTASRMASSEISPAGSSRASFSTSCFAARRLPSTRSAIHSSVSTLARCCCAARRSASHCGSSSRETAFASTTVPAPSSAPNHAVLKLCQSSSRQHHEHDRVLGQARAQRLDRLAALGAGLARGNADLEEPLRGEEREVGRRGAQLRPVRARLGGEHLALGAAVAARGRADGVAGLQREERLRAVHRVEGREPLPQVLGEAARGDLHRGGAPACTTAMRRRMRPAASTRISSKSSRSSASFASGADLRVGDDAAQLDLGGLDDHLPRRHPSPGSPPCSRSW